MNAVAAWVYNVHIHVTFRRARFWFFVCLSECTQSKWALLGHPSATRGTIWGFRLWCVPSNTAWSVSAGELGPLLANLCVLFPHFPPFSICLLRISTFSTRPANKPLRLKTNMLSSFPQRWREKKEMLSLFFLLVFSLSFKDIPYVLCKNQLKRHPLRLENEPSTVEEGLLVGIKLFLRVSMAFFLLIYMCSELTEMHFHIPVPLSSPWSFPVFQPCPRPVDSASRQDGRSLGGLIRNQCETTSSGRHQ